MKIAIDAGHGYNTAGKRSPGPEVIREWTMNNLVALAFEKEIKKYEGVTTVRLDDVTGKTDVGLIERTNKVIKEKCDVVLSIHHNAYQSKWGDHGGTETLKYDGKGNDAYAQAMNDSIVKTLGLRDRGIKHKNFHMIREPKVPAVMVEVGFMDSNTDTAIRDPKNSELVGINLAKDFAVFFGLTLRNGETGTVPEDKPVSKPSEKPKDKSRYNQTGRFTITANSIFTRTSPQANKTNGELYKGNHFDYNEVWTTNGHVWIGNGKVWLPTGQASGGERTGPEWGTFGTIPTSSGFITLDKVIKAWTVHRLGENPTNNNIVGRLNPKKFGGLKYKILDRPYNDVVTIQTGDFGKVNLYYGGSNKKYAKFN